MISPSLMYYVCLFPSHHQLLQTTQPCHISLLLPPFLFHQWLYCHYYSCCSSHTHIPLFYPAHSFCFIHYSTQPIFVFCFLILYALNYTILTIIYQSPSTQLLFCLPTWVPHYDYLFLAAPMCYFLFLSHAFSPIDVISHADSSIRICSDPPHNNPLIPQHEAPPGPIVL